MKITLLNSDYSIMQTERTKFELDKCNGIISISATSDEISIVCPSSHNITNNVIKRDDGWRCFKIDGILEFSMVGIIAAISKILSENSVSIFVISTFNTDYFLVKKEKADEAYTLLKNAGYTMEGEGND